MERLTYTPVIATFERPEFLKKMLGTLAEQSRPPERTIVIDSSRNDETRLAVESMAARLPIHYERAEIPSAAQQRNQGSRLVTTPLIAFIDDDDALQPDVCEKLCAVFESDPANEIGGVSARLIGGERPVPGKLLWWYYRIQAGFSHPTYGGKLFGPAINCYPSYTEQSTHDLIPADWLNSTCVFYRADSFAREQFPDFPGYSFMEDVHLSARIARRQRLYFHTTARFEHHDATSSWKRDLAEMERNRLRNQRRVAREILGLSGPALESKLFLHRLFVTVYLLRRRDPGLWQRLTGTWL
ncbi:MAG: glycosyltransferase [Chthoniobacteraceae bacterium]|jgi:GT2 family glycosyltransferase